MNILLDFMRLHPPSLQLTLFNILKKTQNTLFKQSSKLNYQKTKSKTKLLSPDCLMSIVIGLTQSVIIYVNNAKTISPLKSPDLIKFCQQLFFWDQINFYQQQYKKKLEGKSLAPIILNKFKAFFCKVLGNSQAFINIRLGLKRIININMKKSQIRLYTQSTYKLSLKSFISLQLTM